MKIHGELGREEISTAGKLLDTHAKAAHAEAAADKMIETGESAEKGK